MTSTMEHEPDSSEFELGRVLEPVEWIIMEEAAEMHDLIYGVS